MTTALPATRRVPCQSRRGAAIAWRARGHYRSISRCGKDLMLIVASIALMVGLGAEMASLVPVAYETGMMRPHHWRSARGRAVVAAMPNQDPGTRSTPSPVMAWDRAPGPDSKANRLHSSAGPWRSPLYPQNGVTLWDRIRVSALQDRQAFLLGMAIQLHAPEAATTPGMHRVYPSKEG
jgi:hypothetical protein